MQYTLQQQGYIYSIDKNITLSKLKKGKELKDSYDFDSIKDWMEEKNINMVVDGMEDFHSKLTSIKNSPYVIYYKGNIDLLDKKLIGFVGPRKNSDYGQKVLEKMFQKLKNYDIASISGMATGIDSISHRLSIKKGLPTIAVLGGGLGYYLRKSERQQINKIVENGGLVLSEFPLKKQPQRYTFPKRNRIIAGLSNFVFLPEAGKGSGSLITVDFANKMDIPVYGTPNSIFKKNSKGLNDYIMEGNINPVSDIQKFIVSQLGEPNKSVNNQSSQVQNLSTEEKDILDIFEKQEKLKTRQIVKQTDYNTGKVMEVLTKLEVNGLIRQVSAGVYEIA